MWIFHGNGFHFKKTHQNPRAVCSGHSSESNHSVYRLTFGTGNEHAESRSTGTWISGGAREGGAALHGKGFLATETRKRLSWVVFTHKVYNGTFKLVIGRVDTACGWLVSNKSVERQREREGVRKGGGVSE